MNQQKKNMELNDAQLESGSGGVELDTIRVTDLIEAKRGMMLTYRFS